MEPIVLAPPRPADPPAVERGWRRWEALPGGEARDAAKEAAREPPWRTVLDGLFGGSPFLSEALLAEPEVLGRLVRDGAEAAFGALLAEVEDLDAGDRARSRARPAPLPPPRRPAGRRWPTSRACGRSSG